MNLRGKIVSVLGAAVLAAGMAAPSVAQTTPGQSTSTNIDVKIGDSEDGGRLSFSFIQNVDFPDVPFSNADQNVIGGMTLSVQDTRGRSEGWQFSIRGTNFTAPGTDDIIPIGNFTVEQGAVTRISGDTRLPTAAAPFSMTTSSTVMFSAPKGTGNGRYSVPVTGTLVIPGGTDIGTYTSTITGDLVTAP